MGLSLLSEKQPIAMTDRLQGGESPAKKGPQWPGLLGYRYFPFSPGYHTVLSLSQSTAGTAIESKRRLFIYPNNAG
ncbi:hypothetical protein SKAU_G00184360 [Synaphobranchus kaupii]|uniref:Uncharacterized protein n=1 Tax=Synaphobranchus kaupii TaxID=118154 RepID=A0A9Q1IUJ5_SYNKA|nr:hypothetical protein SKAU_G00184360 [Synaphobranchus kaupii]